MPNDMPHPIGMPARDRHLCRRPVNQDHFWL